LLLLFHRHRLFHRSQAIKVLFGFPADAEPSDFVDSERFKMHSAYLQLIQMIDTAMQMIGPAHELLTEMCVEFLKNDGCATVLPVLNH
jgi:hypothetical protein